jgi:hypothetical protein
MRIFFKLAACALAAVAAAAGAGGQVTADRPVNVETPPLPARPVQLTDLPQAPPPGTVPATQASPQFLTQAVPAPAAATDAVRELLAFRESDVKFSIADLMSILRDTRHEGWVLAAYPDPKTGHPLIGAGFTLDLPARAHPQTDPLNPHPFIEPSSAELWQAAGLSPERLQTVLNEFDTRLAAWSKKGFRRRIAALSPQITGEDANRLLRVAVIQAAYNAKGYCHDFDRLSASQQMALTQLVYQMGYNLQQFGTFLSLMNGYVAGGDAAAVPAAFDRDAAYWKTVQQSLVQSQWARLYRVRAVSVIAMLDPEYPDGPRMAEQRVGAMLHPAVAHRRAGRRAASSRQVASRGKGHSAGPRSRTRQSRKRSA